MNEKILRTVRANMVKQHTLVTDYFCFFATYVSEDESSVDVQHLGYYNTKVLSLLVYHLLKTVLHAEHAVNEALLKHLLDE